MKRIFTLLLVTASYTGYAQGYKNEPRHDPMTIPQNVPSGNPVPAFLLYADTTTGQLAWMTGYAIIPDSSRRKKAVYFLDAAKQPIKRKIVFTYKPRT